MGSPVWHRRDRPHLSRGSKLDPQVFKLKWKEAAGVDCKFFPAVFRMCGCRLYMLGWEWMPDLLAGVAMSSTSVTVVYAVMIEFGFNTTPYGKTVLAACFVTDLGTVVALGLVAPFTVRPWYSSGSASSSCVVLPWLTPHSSNCTATGHRNWKRNSSCFAFSAWARWRPRPMAKRFFRPI